MVTLPSMMLLTTILLPIQSMFWRKTKPGVGCEWEKGRGVGKREGLGEGRK